MIPRPDRKVIDILNDDVFTLSAEIVPPRNGVSMQVILDQIQALISAGAEFLSVTKGAGGALRGGSLPIAQTIKETFKVPAIAHFTCRDLQPEEVESQLIDHHHFGIRNILALRGDPPVGVEGWQPREGSYTYAYKLVEQIRKLNGGTYLERPGFKVQDREKTDFCIGVACYPDHPVEDERLEFYRLKIEAGAEYAISQMIFDPDSYARFLDDCAKVGLFAPILPGLRLVRTRAQAERMATRFGIPVPKTFLATLPDKEGEDAWAMDSAMKLAEEFRRKGAPGLHLFVLSETKLSASVLKALKTERSNSGLGRVQLRPAISV